MKYIPDTGHLIQVNFDPQAGREQAGWRPAIVLSPATYNRIGLAIVAPITNQAKGYPFEVPIPRGLKIEGVILSDHLKSIDWLQRKARYKDAAPVNVIKQAQQRIALLLGLATP